METEVFKIYKETTHTRWGHRVYEVSNLGRVKCNGKIVEPYMNNKYLCIGTFYIHRAVAELFVPNPDNKPYVDHINTDCLDNRAENLRWVTQAENNRNPLTRKHRSEACKGKLFSEETRKRMGESKKGNTNFKGKHHSEETKRKMSEVHKGLTKGRHWKLVDGKRIWYD